MALPEFFARVADSLRPVADVHPDALAHKLSGVRVRIDLVSLDPGALGAFMLACNLAARLYPHIAVSATVPPSDAAENASGPADDLTATARRLILSINPQAEVDTVDRVDTAAVQPPCEAPGEPVAASSPADETSATNDICLRIGARGTDHDITGASPVTVDAYDWNIVVDPNYTSIGRDDDMGGRQPGHPLAWLAVAAIGMAEVFRCVFADELGPKGRTGPQPGGLDLLTSRPVDAHSAPPVDTAYSDSTAPVDLGEVYLVGAGAIGQAAAYAISRLDAKGVLHVVDPETVTLSNLQRYLLTDANSVDVVKVGLVHQVLTQAGEAASDTSITLEVRPFQGRWGDSKDHLQAEQVLIALDTARDRIVVAATEPKHAYNAWTQVADLGWSRHEDFGTQPCLACLYYPDRPQPSEHELIAEALHQPPLRVLAYLTYNLPIGYPLPGIPAVAELPPPPDSDQWTQVALVEDLVAAGVVDQSTRDTWSNTSIGALYRDGICAGGLLPVGDLPGEVLVPLAHQSALAGVMLVGELLWSRTPQLASQRDTTIEHRYDVLRGFPQVVPRPRERTPHCLCSDHAYVAASSPGA